MALSEVNEVASLISEMVSDEANIIFGTSVDETFGEEISVTLVAPALPGAYREIGSPNGERNWRLASLERPNDSSPPLPPMGETQRETSKLGLSLQEPAENSLSFFSSPSGNSRCSCL